MANDARLNIHLTDSLRATDRMAGIVDYLVRITFPEEDDLRTLDIDALLMMADIRPGYRSRIEQLRLFYGLTGAEVLEEMIRSLVIPSIGISRKGRKEALAIIREGMGLRLMPGDIDTPEPKKHWWSR